MNPQIQETQLPCVGLTQENHTKAHHKLLKSSNKGNYNSKSSEVQLW